MQPTLTPPANAFWIGSDHPFDLHEVYLCFRSPGQWRLAQPPARAQLFITADSRYKLWVNGRFVARGPARSFPDAQTVDSLEIGDYLRAGANTIAVQVYQPGYSHFSYIHRGAAGLLAWLVCDGETSLVTDATWRIRRDPAFAEVVPRVSIYGSGVEAQDLTLAEPWQESAYDDRAWKAARIVAPAGIAPWTTLQLRSLPLLVERVQPLALLETRQGATVVLPGEEIHTALRTGWFAAHPQASILTADDWHTVTLTAGEARYWLFDLGRNYTVQGWAEVAQADGGELLAVSYQEKIRNGQLVISDPQTYCRTRITDSFRLRPGEQTVESFALRGGRYLLFRLTGPTDNLRIRFHARVAKYPISRLQSLVTQDPLLNQIMTLCETTHAACLQDGFVDCCWRESSQWLGDALPQSLIMAAMSQDVGPLRQVIEMAAYGAYPDGILPSVLPGEVHAYTIPRYNFMWVELLDLYIRLTQDRAFLQALWPTLQKMLTVLCQTHRTNGLLFSPPGRRFYIDWSPTSQQQPHAVYNLHGILALQVAARLADTCGEMQDAVAWRCWAADLQAYTRTAFWSTGRWWDDLGRTTFSQLAVALALLTHSTEPSEENVLLDAIIARSLDPSDEPAPSKMVLAGPFMHHYLFEALRSRDCHQAAIDIIKLRWGRWVQAGYPTTWENWSVDFPDGSQCHAFSAHPRYHLAMIAQALGGL